MSDCHFGVSPVNYPDPEIYQEQDAVFPEVQMAFLGALTLTLTPNSDAKSRQVALINICFKQLKMASCKTMPSITVTISRPQHLIRKL